MAGSLQPNTMNAKKGKAKKGLTPLMSAALEGCDDTVTSLLDIGASPDRTDDDGDNALIYAIRSKCPSTISLLAPVTTVKLGRALACMADYKVELKTGELRQLVERVVQDREAAIEGLEGAAKFGSSLIIDEVSFHSS